MFDSIYGRPEMFGVHCVQDGDGGDSGEVDDYYHGWSRDDNDEYGLIPNCRNDCIVLLTLIIYGEGGWGQVEPSDVKLSEKCSCLKMITHALIKEIPLFDIILTMLNTQSFIFGNLIFANK